MCRSYPYNVRTYTPDDLVLSRFTPPSSVTDAKKILSTLLEVHANIFCAPAWTRVSWSRKQQMGGPDRHKVTYCRSMAILLSSKHLLRKLYAFHSERRSKLAYMKSTEVINRKFLWAYSQFLSRWTFMGFGNGGRGTFLLLKWFGQIGIWLPPLIKKLPSPRFWFETGRTERKITFLIFCLFIFFCFLFRLQVRVEEFLEGTLHRS